MKKRSTATLLAALLLTTSVLSPCQTDTASAAGKIKVSRTKVTVLQGEKATVQAKNTGNRKIKANVSNKKIISVKVIKKKIRITGKKQGNTKVTLTASHMKKCVIRVFVKRNDESRFDTVISTTAPSKRPVSTPYVRVTGKPTMQPMGSPSSTAKAGGTAKPAGSPSTAPEAGKTAKPAKSPSAAPEAGKTAKPAGSPSSTPMTDRTAGPSISPSSTPEAEKTTEPSNTPSSAPTKIPASTAEPTESPETMLDTTRLCIAEKSLYIGESVENLKEEWGEPDRIDPLPQKNITGYIYNSDSTTKPYLLVGIKNQKVTSYFTIGKGFTAYDATVDTADQSVSQQTILVEQGDSAASLVSDGWEEPGAYEFDALDSDQNEARVGTEAYYRLTDNAHVYAMTDYFDGGSKAIYGFYAFSRTDNTKYDIMYRTCMTFDDEILQAAEQQVFEMTNAYRNYMGMSFLQWDDKAASAAKKHSLDMAENQYFSHYGKDGSTPATRMKAEGVSGSGWSENICVGSQDAISMVIGWIGSSGHRRDILLDMKYIGVGIAYNASDEYGTYATQDFWR